MLPTGFSCVKKGLGCVLFWAVLPRKIHNLALDRLENPVTRSQSRKRENTERGDKEVTLAKHVGRGRDYDAHFRFRQ